jgi:hypothetical protein
MIGTPGGSEWWHRGCLNLFRHTRESMEQFSNSAPAVESERRVARSLAAAPSILCALSHHSFAQDSGIGITGTVRYYSNDEPVPDAFVQLTGVGVPVSAVTEPGTHRR